MLRKPNHKKKEQSTSRHPRVGVGVIITKDDQVLLMKRRNVHGDGTWSAPGGHLEYGELPEQCVIREALEEVGVIITDATFLAITNDIFDVPEMHVVTIWMAGSYVSGTPTMQAGHEISAVGWFSWDALPEPLFLPFEHLLTGRCYPALWDFSGGEGARRNNR